MNSNHNHTLTSNNDIPEKDEVNFFETNLFDENNFKIDIDIKKLSVLEYWTKKNEIFKPTIETVTKKKHLQIQFLNLFFSKDVIDGYETYKKTRKKNQVSRKRKKRNYKLFPFSK